MKSKRHPINPAPRDPVPGGGAPLRRWYVDKAPLIRFGAKFCALTVLLYLILLVPVCKQVALGATVVDARLSGAILNLLGQRNHVEGATMLAGSRPVITVVTTCTGFDFLCIFSAAVLVFPVPFAKKIAGLLIGVPLLLALNLVRIISLYFLGVHYPGVFDMAHEEIWAVILIAATITLYIAWMRWAGPAALRPLDATA